MQAETRVCKREGCDTALPAGAPLLVKFCGDDECNRARVSEANARAAANRRKPKPSGPRTCKQPGCGAGIPAGASPRQKFCRSYECDLARARDRGKTYSDTRRSNKFALCKVCDAKFHTATVQKFYCSKRCKRTADHAARMDRTSGKSCAECGASLPRVKGRRYLCTRCKPPTPPPVRESRQCPQCDSEFFAVGYRKRYCTPKCAAEANVAPYHQARLELRKPGRSVTPTLVTYLLERDKCRCHLCGKKVDPKADRRKHPKAAVIDHLVPFSISRDSSLANLALAHLKCNLVKNNKPAGEQLLLIG